MVPALPPPGRAALLLDLDGTLLDIAPRPDAVVVPSGLTDDLRALRQLLGDALAVVTGRPVEIVDALLGDAAFAVAGEHGGAIRHAPGQPVERSPLPSPPGEWLVAAERLALAHPGALLEHKAHGFALHFRAAPTAGPALREALLGLLADSAEFELLPAHMLWEVRPRATDKGKAVVALLERAPFEGRLPIFVGDDVTDEDGIAAAASVGGVGLRVQEAFGAAAEVRAWLHAAAVAGAWPPAVNRSGTSAQSARDRV
jgi:trehalose 6-phosphate phosphatase